MLALGLIIASWIPYLEWGADNKKFLIELEIELMSNIFKDPLSVIHPLIIIPFLGQLLLIYTLFQKKINKKLALAGFIGMGILVGVILVVGVISSNIKMLISTLPFFIIGILLIRHKDTSAQG